MNHTFCTFFSGAITDVINEPDVDPYTISDVINEPDIGPSSIK